MNSGDPAEKLPPASSNPPAASPAKPATTPKNAPPRRTWGEFVPPSVPQPARPVAPMVVEKPAVDTVMEPAEVRKAARAARIHRYTLVFGLLGIAVITLIYAFWATTIGWHNTLYSDRHPFRQSQTAINCFYMLQTGYTLDYQTPVLGSPWRVPFEFPLYQWAVVWAVKFFHAALDPSGRGVSVAFYLLTLIPMYFVAQALKVAPAHRLIFLILMLVSPFYLFWSRAFMLESTALFLSMSCLACTMQYDWRRTASTHIFPFALLLLPAMVFGIFAAMVKITTFFPFGLAIAIFMARNGVRWPLPIRLPWRRIDESLIALAISVGIPVLAAFIWTAHADHVKGLSPVTTYLQSYNANMATEIFGTDAQRFSWETWSDLLGRGGTLAAPEWTLWLGCLAVIGITRRRWKEVAVLVFLFVSAPFVFLNLHQEHDYYMYANGVFLLGAVGFSILALFEAQHHLLVGFAGLLIITLASMSEFSAYYYPMMAKNNNTLHSVISVIGRTCDPDSVVVYLGLDWDPTLPYYTQRRAFMLPSWINLSEDDVRKELETMQSQGVKIGCIVEEVDAMRKEDRAFMLVTMKGLGMDTSKELPVRRAGD